MLIAYTSMCIKKGDEDYYFSFCVANPCQSDLNIDCTTATSTKQEPKRLSNSSGWAWTRRARARPCPRRRARGGWGWASARRAWGRTGRGDCAAAVGDYAGAAGGAVAGGLTVGVGLDTGAGPPGADVRVDAAGGWTSARHCKKSLA